MNTTELGKTDIYSTVYRCVEGRSESGRPSFSILCEDRSGRTVYDTVRDVSSVRERAEEITELLNKNRVSHLHFRDVLEDIL